MTLGTEWCKSKIFLFPGVPSALTVPETQVPWQVSFGIRGLSGLSLPDRRGERGLQTRKMAPLSFPGAFLG